MLRHPIPFKVQLTPNWSITLKQQFRQRTEGVTLVLFNQQLSIWIRSYGTEGAPNILGRMERDAGFAPENALELTKHISGGIGRVSYLVPAILTGDNPRPPNFYTYAHAVDTQLMMSFVHKDQAGLDVAKSIYATLTYDEVLSD